MTQPIIEVENLSKCYKLGSIGASSLRDEFSRRWDRLRGREEVADTRDFWALRDVSFSIQPGEVVGIIGRNGAGKSTLLKVLSRITEPTSGQAILRGRAASLLEVGTGFHPDLTGRENIFLNGAILGMSKAEIRRKFDEIVDFAGVERFLDTPVKRYSSGMYVRLAFAVAAHLEPEILIIDEVLAVGDTEFQKKCIGKMEQVASGGRTVIFVSHNMNAVTALTNRCVFLSGGRMRFAGPTAEAVAAYFQDNKLANQPYRAPARPADADPHFGSIHIVPSDAGGIQGARRPFEIHLSIEHSAPVEQAYVTVQIANQHHQTATQFWLLQSDFAFCRGAGPTKLVCQIPDVRFNAGHYTLKAMLGERPGGRILDQVEGVCGFEVVKLYETESSGWRQDAGLYQEDASWTVLSD